MNHTTTRPRRARLALAALALLAAATSHAAPSATLHALYDFSRPANAQGGPRGELVRTSDGRYVGVTLNGGEGGRSSIYSTNLQGDTRTLYVLDEGRDGSMPNGPLVQMADGSLYGTAYSGGPHGAGTVFRLAPDGAFTVLHAFSGKQPGGYGPSGGLLLASDGNFYGATTLGGQDDAGIFYRISPAGDYLKLAEFVRGRTGNQPAGSLLETADHRLVGVTVHGGASDGGTVYSAGFDGTLVSLAQFEPYGAGPATPGDGLVDGGDGWLYGTSGTGGGWGFGTVYRIKPDGSELGVVHAFDYQGRNGESPVDRLLRGDDGWFYGVTQMGGLAADGIVYRVAGDGRFSRLVDFVPALTGSRPFGLVHAGPKQLLGAAPFDGPDGRGDTFVVDLAPE